LHLLQVLAFTDRLNQLISHVPHGYSCNDRYIPYQYVCRFGMV